LHQRFAGLAPGPRGVPREEYREPKDDNAIVRHLIDAIDEHNTARFEVAHNVLVVNDLVPNVHR
jgi:hypothetical protein